jgi:hypothetical protein
MLLRGLQSGPESKATQTERQHPDQQLAESLQADAELQKAVRVYIAEQSPENRRLLASAVNRLQDLIPWPEVNRL